MTPADLGMERVHDSTCDGLLDHGSQYPDTWDDALSVLRALTAADLDNPHVALELRWSPEATAGIISKYLFGQSKGVIVATDHLGRSPVAVAIRVASSQTARSRSRAGSARGGEVAGEVELTVGGSREEGGPLIGAVAQLDGASERRDEGIGADLGDGGYAVRVG